MCLSLFQNLVVPQDFKNHGIDWLADGSSMLKQSEITLSAVLFSFFSTLNKTDKLSGGSFFESRLAKPMV